MSVLAIDLGGSHVGCAVVDGGKVLGSSSLKIKTNSLRGLLPALREALLAQCQAVGISLSGCQGLGIGFPGVVDSATGEILSSISDKFSDLSGAELLAWSATEIGCPAKIENDAKLALLGEHATGAARGYEDVVMVTLGTGIGGAAMLQNRLLHSRFGQAGTVGGHITVKGGHRKCVCGNLGCAEAEASTSVLADVCREWPGFQESALAGETQFNFVTLFRWKDAGDPVAGAILAHCIDVWSSLAVALTHAYGPQRMLFGGGVLNRANEILPPIRAYVDEHCWRSSRGIVSIAAAALGEQAGLIGAESLFSEPAG